MKKRSLYAVSSLGLAAASVVGGAFISSNAIASPGSGPDTDGVTVEAVSADANGDMFSCTFDGAARPTTDADVAPDVATGDAETAPPNSTGSADTPPVDASGEAGPRRDARPGTDEECKQLQAAFEAQPVASDVAEAVPES